MARPRAGQPGPHERPATPVRVLRGPHRRLAAGAAADGRVHGRPASGPRTRTCTRLVGVSRRELCHHRMSLEDLLPERSGSRWPPGPYRLLREQHAAGRQPRHAAHPSRSADHSHPHDARTEAAAAHRRARRDHRRLDQERHALSGTRPRHPGRAARGAWPLAARAGAGDRCCPAGTRRRRLLVRTRHPLAWPGASDALPARPSPRHETAHARVHLLLHARHSRALSRAARACSAPTSPPAPWVVLTDEPADFADLPVRPSAMPRPARWRSTTCSGSRQPATAAAPPPITTSDSRCRPRSRTSTPRSSSMPTRASDALPPLAVFPSGPGRPPRRAQEHRRPPGDVRPLAPARLRRAGPRSHRRRGRPAQRRRGATRPATPSPGTATKVASSRRGSARAELMQRQGVYSGEGGVMGLAAAYAGWTIDYEALATLVAVRSPRRRRAEGRVSTDELDVRPVHREQRDPRPGAAACARASASSAAAIAARRSSPSPRAPASASTARPAGTRRDWASNMSRSPSTGACPEYGSANRVFAAAWAEARALRVDRRARQRHGLPGRAGAAGRCRRRRAAGRLERQRDRRAGRPVRGLLEPAGRAPGCVARLPAVRPHHRSAAPRPRLLQRRARRGAEGARHPGARGPISSPARSPPA